MLNRLRNKFAAKTAPPRIEIQSRSLAEDNKDWESQSFENVTELREHMSYYITGQLSQPWGYIIRNADLNGMDLTGLNRTRQWVSKEAAEHVLIGGSEFSNIQMQDARMINARFFGTRFEKCDFNRSQMIRTDFSSDKTHYFMFMMNPFQQAHEFGTTRLKDVLFCGAELRNSCFIGAQLENVDFSGADLRGVDFTGVDVNSCRFDGANIEGATFTHSLVKAGLLAKTSGKPLMESGMGAAQMHHMRRLRRKAP